MAAAKKRSTPARVTGKATRKVKRKGVAGKTLKGRMLGGAKVKTTKVTGRKSRAGRKVEETPLGV